MATHNLISFVMEVIKVWFILTLIHHSLMQ